MDNGIMNERDKAFTLLEILFTLVIFMVLASLTAPRINLLLNRIRLDSDLREMYLTFLKARQLAITRQEDCGLEFKEKEREYILYTAGGDVLDKRKLNKGINYGEIVFGGDSKMIFKPSGTAEGGHLTLSTEGVSRGYQITVSGVTGRVRQENITGKE